MKNFIKNTPLLGFLARWLNNLVRLNNLKYKVDILQDQNQLLRQQLQNLQEIVEHGRLDIREEIKKEVADQIFYQSLSLQQRVDQFIFDSNIELKTKIAETADK